MAEELLHFGLAAGTPSIIKVIGVGGGGGNAVNNMHLDGIRGVEFILCNTDAQALTNSPVANKVQLGMALTEGRGAGNSPERGKEAAIESAEEIKTILSDGTRMVFITVCMGGGTGTGAAPVIAEIARNLGILTIAIATVPSTSEGKRRYNQALEGLDELRDNVDSILVINNKKLHEIYGNLPASEAFSKADEVIKKAVKGAAEIITVHGNINIDFADVQTVMSGSGVFLMGTGIAQGENRAIEAAENALKSPLLDRDDIFGTKSILLNIISGTQEVTMSEIGAIIDYLQEAAGMETDIIWGNGKDEQLGEEISVTVIATGFDHDTFIPEDERSKAVSLSVEPEEIEHTPEKEVVAVEPDEQFEHHHEEVLQEEMVEETMGTTEKPKSEVMINNWFFRQFNNLFDEKDTELKE